MIHRMRRQLLPSLWLWPRPESTRAFRPLTACAVLFLIGACARQEAPRIPQPSVDGDRIVFATDSPQRKALVSQTADAAIAERQRFNGRLVWDESRTVRVFAPLGGRIGQIKGQPGQSVRAGDPLATISSPDFGQAQAEAAKANADYAVAEKALGRANELAEKGVLAAKDLQQAEADYQRAKAERDRTVARARLFGGAGNVDQQFALRAPIAGTVVERNVNPGQEVRPDQAQPGAPALFVVSDPSRLWVQLELPEAALADVRPGMEFVLKVPAAADLEARGRIEWIADNVDPVTRTTRARGSIDNNARRLKAEMFVTAEMDVPREEFQRIPAAAVLLLGDGQYVFVDEGDGRYRRQKVVADEEGTGRMRVRSGLKPGERIVTDGVLLLQQILATATK